MLSKQRAQEAQAARLPPSAAIDTTHEAFLASARAFAGRLVPLLSEPLLLRALRDKKGAHGGASDAPKQVLQLLEMISQRDGFRQGVLEANAMAALVRILRLCRERLERLRPPPERRIERGSGSSSGTSDVCREARGRLQLCLRMAVQSMAFLTQISPESCSWPPCEGQSCELVAILRDVWLDSAVRRLAACSLKHLAALNDTVRLAMAPHIQDLVEACLEAHRAEGDAVLDSSALCALTSMLAEGGPTADAALAAVANLVSNRRARARFVELGGIALLQAPLRSEHEGIYKNAGWVIASLAVDTDISGDFTLDGGIPLLLQYARSADLGHQEEAAWGLANLSSQSELTATLMRANVVPLLVTFARSESDGVRMQALWTLANLAVHPEFRQEIARERTIPALLDSFRDPAPGTHHSLTQAARALSNLVVTSENRAETMAHGGGEAILRCALSESNEVQQAVARVIVNLSYEVGVAMQLVSAGALPVVASLLGSDCDSVQQEATWMAVNFSLCIDGQAPPPRGSPAFGAEMVLPLLHLLRSARREVLEQAAWALFNLARSRPNKMAMLSHGALSLLAGLPSQVDMRAGGSSSGVRAASGTLLTSLAEALTPTSRRAIVGPGSERSQPPSGLHRGEAPQKVAMLSAPAGPGLLEPQFARFAVSGAEEAS
ncbi:hypothetical protein EMIHUDRAFT_252097 [Emiliania huxleyi CCMP1516]|nr:hypothetical protein EMIHUDRAFT_252097 [Emiliania huxleyi CCMP1516]EOD37442.1 hypothetical protein EMIHUDRAFT_252097 [Emiliania huxleyi CCMP1516]|eukprot:XP_005789871.1 hypothetical protein EMIHUDRAFT_252097 [Emiliania huxleyi CCMP1516]